MIVKFKNYFLIFNIMPQWAKIPINNFKFAYIASTQIEYIANFALTVKDIERSFYFNHGLFSDLKLAVIYRLDHFFIPLK